MKPDHAQGLSAEDGGYRKPAFWLSDGWAAVTARRWAAPLHWRKPAGRGRGCRNFFPSAARWQFSGVRLARDGAGL